MEYSRPFDDGWLDEVIKNEKEFVCDQIKECFGEDDDYEEIINAFVEKSLESLAIKMKVRFENSFNKAVEELKQLHHEKEKALKDECTETVLDAQNEYCEKLQQLNSTIIKELLPTITQKIPDFKKDLLSKY